MKLRDECRDCLKNNQIKKIEAYPVQDDKTEQLIHRIKELCATYPADRSAPHLMMEINRLHKEIFGYAVDYQKEKEYFNALCLSYEEEIAKVISSSDDPLKSAIAAVSPENIVRGLTCVVAAAMDAVTKRLSEITGTNRLLLQGQRLGISPDNPDEGVWLSNPETGRTVAMATVERSDDQTIDCFFAEPPTPGTYTLVVSCRNGERESLKPAVAKIKNFTVKAA